MTILQKRKLKSIKRKQQKRKRKALENSRAFSAATPAAKAVPFFEPRKPLAPAEDAAKTPPVLSGFRKTI